MGLFHNLVSMTTFHGSPFLSNIVPAAAVAYGINVGLGVPSIFKRTELLFDFSGGLTFIFTLLSCLFAPLLRSSGGLGDGLGSSIRACNWRQVTITGASALYSIRLYSYLIHRLIRKGHDARFDQTKHKPRRFFVIWMAQATWVLLCAMPVMAVDAVSPSALPDHFTATDVIGGIVFVVGFAIETTADYQRNTWIKEKLAKIHDEQFMTRGLFSRSRYPHYFGDIMLWVGMAILSAGVLVTGSVQADLGWGGLTGCLKAILLPALAPSFAAWGLLKVTGVPPSERKYDKLYGHRKDYQEWRFRTPLLIPKIF
ncbi:hypothetical protein B0H63DRAFT_462544 [Podospora didyma]|uniref:Steroid 5-alpha reductase C-terminal domain-containing protein n=1 Tax=Podospora didyma TaxID=330526 RepID=A0AAE0U908_9PEZI|nr:hypothetical protein B0H63DRAFT_462544 [Podospora didyma]